MLFSVKHAICCCVIEQPIVDNSSVGLIGAICPIFTYQPIHPLVALTYLHTTIAKEEILYNHTCRSVLCPIRMSTKDEEHCSPPTLQCLFKQRNLSPRY
jgi:hypothetical protein